MKLNQYHDLEDWLSWVDELSSKNFVVIDQFVRQDVYSELRSFFLSHLQDFSKAGIGALESNVIRHDIRGDHTYWLDRKRDEDLNSFWSIIDETMHVFNRYCFLSLSGYEFHLANYPPGSEYKKHLDQFDNRSNRMITIILYLNEGWKKGDGGELEIFLHDHDSVIIEPLGGRCVIFKSAELPHRVLASHKNRYSLTGWLLYQPSALGQFFG